jgi:hypothetical protein
MNDFLVVVIKILLFFIVVLFFIIGNQNQRLDKLEKQNIRYIRLFMEMKEAVNNFQPKKRPRIDMRIVWMLLIIIILVYITIMK